MALKFFKICALVKSLIRLLMKMQNFVFSFILNFVFNVAFNFTFNFVSTVVFNFVFCLNFGTACTCTKVCRNGSELCVSPSVESAVRKGLVQRHGNLFDCYLYITGALSRVKYSLTFRTPPRCFNG